MYYRPERAIEGEVWSPDVLKLSVMEANQKRGTVYLDLTARERKLGGDCHFTVQCSKLVRYFLIGVFLIHIVLT